MEIRSFSAFVLALFLAQGLRAEKLSLGGLELDSAQVSVEPQEGYTRILADLYPVQAQRKSLGGKFSLKKFAEALVKGPGRQRDSKLSAFKVYLVEYTLRDDYSQPVLSGMQVLWQGEGKLSKGRLRFSKIKAEKGN